MLNVFRLQLQILTVPHSKALYPHQMVSFKNQNFSALILTERKGLLLYQY